MSRRNKMKLKRIIKRFFNSLLVVYIAIATFLFSMYWFSLFVEFSSEILINTFN